MKLNVKALSFASGIVAAVSFIVCALAVVGDEPPEKDELDFDWQVRRGASRHLRGDDHQRDRSKAEKCVEHGALRGVDDGREQDQCTE
jgi:hypothetical protein